MSKDVKGRRRKTPEGVMARPARLLPSAWNLKAIIWFLFPVSCLVFLPSIVCTCILFCWWSFLLTVSTENSPLCFVERQGHFVWLLLSRDLSRDDPSQVKSSQVNTLIIPHRKFSSLLKAHVERASVQYITSHRQSITQTEHPTMVT